jgi:hypothetical protein
MAVGGGGGASLACSCLVIGDVFRMLGYGVRSEIDDLLVATHINLGPAH